LKALTDGIIAAIVLAILFFLLVLALLGRRWYLKRRAFVPVSQLDEFNSLLNKADLNSEYAPSHTSQATARSPNH
jgi:hypothetical protein